MTDNYIDLISALKKVGIPVQHELALTSGTDIPCISVMELSNVDSLVGDTITYSDEYFQIKVWSTQIKDLQKYALKVDKILKPLGYKRTGCTELYDRESGMAQKILTYQGLDLETN